MKIKRHKKIMVIFLIVTLNELIIRSHELIRQLTSQSGRFLMKQITFFSSLQLNLQYCNNHLSYLLRMQCLFFLLFAITDSASLIPEQKKCSGKSYLLTEFVTRQLKVKLSEWPLECAVLCGLKK